MWVFLHCLTKHTVIVHAYVSPRLSWFILGAVSALDHMVFIWFHFKKQNEMKNKNKEKYKKNYFMKMNKMKRK